VIGQLAERPPHEAPKLDTECDPAMALSETERGPFLPTWLLRPKPDPLALVKAEASAVTIQGDMIWS
jgi:hypothetical protein